MKSVLMKMAEVTTPLLKKIQSLPQGEFARITFEVSSACNTGDAVSYRVKGGLYAKTGRKPLRKVGE